MLPLVPTADIRVFTFAARLSIGAERHDVNLALDARIQVLIRTAPRVVGQFVQVGFPVRGHRAGGRSSTLGTISAASTPMITSTTISSIKVKPADRRCRTDGREKVREVIWSLQ